MTFVAEDSQLLGEALSWLPFPASREAGHAIRVEDAQPVSAIANLPQLVLDALFPHALTAAGGLPGLRGSFNPAQARVPRGNRNGGRWLGTAGTVADDLKGALNRSMNRLDKGVDIGDRELPGTPEEVRAERRRLAEKVLKEEGRPGLDEIADRVSTIYARTTPEQRAAGKKWYDQAKQLAYDMVDDPRTDLTLEQSAAIIAHLSTRTRWEANESYARSLAAGMSQNEALAFLKGEVLAGRIAKPRQGGDGIMDRNWEKALSAAGSSDPIGRDNLNLGSFSERNKTRTFADNIMGDSDGVTIDAWMERILGQGLDAEGNIFPPGKKTGDIRGNKEIRGDKIYESLSEAVRVAAEREGISPAEMQAITWGWALENYVATREGHPGRFVDGDFVFPVRIGGEQELIDSGDLIRASGYLDFDDSEEMPDYWYAMAEKLLGLPREGPFLPKAEGGDVAVAPDLTAAGGFNEGQRRVAKGNPLGGQWVDDAGTIANGLEQFIGPAGTPMTYAEMKELRRGELTRQVNPGYYDDPPTSNTARLYREDKFTRTEYVVNCQRTAIATEMRARGFDVVANGAPREAGKGWANDGTEEDMALVWRQTRDKLPDGVAGQVRFSLGNTPRGAREAMQQYPIGSRFILIGTYGGGAGHAWNAEVIDSPFGPQLVEIDAQTPMNLEREGGSYTLLYDPDKAFTEIQFLRVDDKFPADVMWKGSETTGSPWVQTPEDFARENEAARSNPSEPWEYAAGMPVTFEEARQAVATRSGLPTSPFGWDAGDAWVVAVLTSPTLYNNVAWYVDKLFGFAVEGTLHPGHGFPVVGFLTAAGGFDATQRRVAKGNREGGQWLDTAGTLGNALRGEALRAELKDTYTRITDEALAGTGLKVGHIYVHANDGTDPRYQIDCSLVADTDEEAVFESGHFTRILDTETGTISNEVFELAEEEQGKGIGSKLTKAWEEEYRRQGISSIILEANIDVGGYTWARQGFEFASAEAATGAIFYAQDKLGLDSPFMPQLVEMQTRIARGGTVLPAEIAALGWTEGATTWPGKEGLLGSVWHGVKRLPPAAVTAAAEPSDPRAQQIAQLHDRWVETARYDSIPVAGRSQYPETEEDVHTHADSDIEYMRALFAILLGDEAQDSGTAITAAGGFDQGQKRVQKGNREGGQWIDDAGRIAGALEGASDGIPGHSMTLVEFDSDEFRARADEFSRRTGGSFDTPKEFCGYGESYWAKHAYGMTGFDKNAATIVDVLPDGSTPIYRGLGALREESDQYIEQFKSGDHFPGKGIFGAGSYFTDSRSEAGEYAGWLREEGSSPWSDHTDLIRGALKPGARILTIDNDKNGTGPGSEGGHMFYLDQIRGATGGKEYIPGAGVVGGMNISRDIGAAAAVAGYDAIRVTGLRGGMEYFVIFNRGAMFVTAENEVE